MISLAWMLLTVTIAATAEEVVRFDFESGDLQGWQVVEGQFDRVVSDRPTFHNRYPDQPGNQYNKQGRYYLSTVEQQPGQPSNDRMTGVIESPVFVLADREISMLVGSGTQPVSYVALCTLDGQEVLVARGKDQTEVMQRVRWDATPWVGQKVFLRVVDREQRDQRSGINQHAAHAASPSSSRTRSPMRRCHRPAYGCGPSPAVRPGFAGRAAAPPRP